VNALGPLALFQAAYPLLHASTLTPKFIAISFGVGNIAFGLTVPMDNISCAVATPSPRLYVLMGCMQVWDVEGRENMIIQEIRMENDGLSASLLCYACSCTEATFQSSSPSSRARS
jgi:hypothetical protein